MKSLLKNLSAALALLLLIPGLSPAAPAFLNYQGRLVDSAGNPLVGLQSITFRIYDAAAAGAMIWGPEVQNVTPDNGIFAISLGSV